MTKTPEEKLKDFHQAYAGKWPATMTFVRDVEWTQYNQHENYRRYHAMSFPGKRREDIDIDNGTSEITVNENTFIIKNFRYKGSLPARKDLENYISMYSYHESFDDVKTYLVNAGANLSKGYATTWKGRNVYVIGATTTADSISTQIWYDEVDKYPVRLMQKYPNDPNRYEFRFRMNKIGSIWFPAEMEQYRNSRRIYRSVYSDIKMDVAFEPGVFNPDKFGSYIWYERPPSQ